MISIFKIAWRNLFRYTRRTLLTASLIGVGVILVILFGGIGREFKNEVIGLLTNSSLGDIQIHKKGYVGSIDNLPLDITIPEKGLKKIEEILKRNEEVVSYSKRIRLGAMISNFVQTTNIRLTAIYPEMESKTCPGLPERIKEGNNDPEKFVQPGGIVIPVTLVEGLKLKIGDDVVLVATNKDGSVNGITFKLSGISENILGPTGKDGYIHIEDARNLLRIDGEEIIEIAVKLKNFDKLNRTFIQMKNQLMELKSEKSGKPMFEIHTWEDLSPFASIAKLVTLLITVVRIILIFIVTVSVLNVMLMSVYERIAEIGTIASIGTTPFKILSLFLAEGFSLGLVSAIIGSLLGIGILAIIRAVKLNFTFGMMKLSLAPHILVQEVILTCIIVVIISLLASLQPAIKASRMEPVDALRHV